MTIPSLPPDVELYFVISHKELLKDWTKDIFQFMMKIKDASCIKFLTQQVRMKK